MMPLRVAHPLMPALASPPGLPLDPAEPGADFGAELLRAGLQDAAAVPAEPALTAQTAVATADEAVTADGVAMPYATAAAGATPWPVVGVAPDTSEATDVALAANQVPGWPGATTRAFADTTAWALPVGRPFAQERAAELTEGIAGSEGSEGAEGAEGLAGTTPRAEPRGLALGLDKTSASASANAALLPSGIPGLERASARGVERGLGRAAERQVELGPEPRTGRGIGRVAEASEQAPLHGTARGVERGMARGHERGHPVAAGRGTDRPAPQDLEPRSLRARSASSSQDAGEGDTTPTPLAAGAGPGVQTVAPQAPSAATMQAMSGLPPAEAPAQAPGQDPQPRRALPLGVSSASGVPGTTAAPGEAAASGAQRIVSRFDVTATQPQAVPQAEPKAVSEVPARRAESAGPALAAAPQEATLTAQGPYRPEASDATSQQARTGDATRPVIPGASLATLAQTAQTAPMTPVAQAAQAVLNAATPATTRLAGTASANASDTLRATGTTGAAAAMDSTSAPNPSSATAATTNAASFAALFTAPPAAATLDRPAGLFTPPPAAEVTLPPRWDSAEFLPALGRQVAFFARDGIEHARVHLNPVDMGPIQVQLSLDGTQVRLDLAVEIAATRQLLEQSLPQLASALREGGFTLAGGGVFQDPRQAADGRGEAANAGLAGNGADGRGEGRGQPGSGGASGGSGPGGAATAVPVRARHAEGLVDLYA